MRREILQYANILACTMAAFDKFPVRPRTPTSVVGNGKR